MAMLTEDRRACSFARRALAVWLAIGVCVGVAAFIDARCNPVRCCVITPEGRARADIISLHSALLEYALAHDGAFPDSLDALVEPDENGYRYISCLEVPRDPWGRPYFLRKPVEGEGNVHVVSLGRDGVEGGRGEDADIDSQVTLAEVSSH